MASRYQPHVEFGNFICKFGEDLNLLDYAREIVLPAFLDSNLERKYSDLRYLFYQTRIVILEDGDPPTLAVTGTFIKDTYIERSKTYSDTSGLVAIEPERYETAETAFFVLELNTHKLIYLRETMNSPGIVSFAATAGKFIRIKWESYLREQYTESLVETSDAAPNRKVSFAEYKKRLPSPTVEAVYIASTQDLEQFVARFSKITTVSVQLKRPNDEVHGDDFFDDMERRRATAGGDDAVFRLHSNPGLDKADVLKQVKPVAGKGNATTRFLGKDQHGDTLDGTEESFRLRVPVDSIPTERTSKIKMMWDSFIQHIGHPRRNGTQHRGHDYATLVSLARDMDDGDGDS